MRSDRTENNFFLCSRRKLIYKFPQILKRVVWWCGTEVCGDTTHPITISLTCRNKKTTQKFKWNVILIAASLLNMIQESHIWGFNLQVSHTLWRVLIKPSSALQHSGKVNQLFFHMENQANIFPNKLCHSFLLADNLTGQSQRSSLWFPVFSSPAVSTLLRKIWTIFQYF